MGSYGTNDCSTSGSTRLRKHRNPAASAGGAKPNRRCSRDGTLLHIAAQDGRISVIKALLANGANKDARCDHDGETPLADACTFGNKEVAETLMAVGCDIHLRGTDSHQNAALDRTAQNG